MAARGKSTKGKNKYDWKYKYKYIWTLNMNRNATHFCDGQRKKGDKQLVRIKEEELIIEWSEVIDNITFGNKITSGRKWDWKKGWRLIVL